MATTTVKTERIITDPALQPRIAGLDTEHISALQECPESWPPLVVVERGGLVLVDGFHRYAAAQNLGLDSVTIDVLEVPEGSDLRALAFALNAAHGRPLSLADRRAEAKRLLSADATLSNLEVARRTALSPTTIAAVRQELEAAHAIPSGEQRVNRSGITYAAANRQRGELPAEQETLAERFFTAKERREQRRVAHYLERLAVALDDQFIFQSWAEASDGAAACVAVLGGGTAAELGERLGPAARNILDVAVVLGYEDEA